MGSVLDVIKDVGNGIGDAAEAVAGGVSDVANAVVHTVVTTAHLTIDGVEQAVSVVTNEAGEAVHDVVVGGKVVVKAGQKVFA